MSENNEKTKLVSTESVKGSMYLTFRLNEYLFSVETIRVKEIVTEIHCTSIPGSPNYILGLINLRGTVLPVIALNHCLGIGEIRTEKNVIIVLEHENFTFGIYTSGVVEVSAISKDDLQKQVNFPDEINEELILGLHSNEQEMRILIDWDRFYSEFTLNTDENGDNES